MLRNLAPCIALAVGVAGAAIYAVARTRRIAAERRGQDQPDGTWQQRARDGAVITVEPDRIGWAIRCSRNCHIPESWFGAADERKPTVIFGRKHVADHNAGTSPTG